LAQLRAAVLITVALAELTSVAGGQPPIRRDPPSQGVIVFPRVRSRDLSIAREVSTALALSRDTAWISVRPFADVEIVLTKSFVDYGGNVISPPAPDSSLTPSDMLKWGKMLRANIVLDVSTTEDSVLVHAISTRTGARHRMGSWLRSSRGLARTIATAFEFDSGVSRMLRPK
jgi:hypothetical protein